MYFKHIRKQLIIKCIICQETMLRNAKIIRIKFFINMKKFCDKQLSCLCFKL